VLDRGRLLEEGTARDLYERPRSHFVATFLGAGTVLVGRAESDRAEFGAFSLPIPSDVPHENGARVLVLCRPENVAVASDPDSLQGPRLGQGRIVEETFSGPVRRIRMRLARTPRLRQIAPVPGFGEEGLLVDALIPADRPLPEGEVWAGLDGWKILERPAPRILAADRPDSPAAVAAALALAVPLRGAVTILGVAAEPAQIDAAGADIRGRVERLGGVRAETKVRAGKLDAQLVAEQSEFVYDMLMLDGIERRGKAARSRAALARIIEQASTPMILLKRPWELPQRILVCTAVGEPGKTVIRMAGWLARNIGASVTLFHANLAEEEPPFVRAHLERGLAALRGLDVPCDLSIERSATPAEGILAASRRHDVGMIAMGGHGPRSRSVFVRDDVTMQIVAASDKPILIVPESAW
jgi:nucleotide-binding universal stress UspA family protein